MADQALDAKTETTTLNDTDLVYVLQGSNDRKMQGSNLAAQVATKLDSDDISEGATNLYLTGAERTKLTGIETAADVTDGTNVTAAGAVMDGDFVANGLMTRTAAGTYTSRTATAGTGISIANGDGVLGNPTVSTDDSAIVHDNLSGFVADEHVAHAGVTLTAGTGLTGGGDISSNRTFNVDVGIADDKILQMDQVAGGADNDYCKLTASGVEGRSYSEVKTDLSLDSVENTALSTWAGTSNITTVGTLSAGNVDAAVTAASTTAAGKVELATTAETTTGTDTARAVTPDGLKDGYQGSTNVTTLGTIATGTWQGTAITNTYLDTGIADNKIVEIDDADAADNDYCKLTANGIEGRDYSEVRTDLGVQTTLTDSDSHIAGSGAVFDHVAGITANTQTGTTYTLVLTDRGKLITLNNASAITLTIPANASVAFAVGTQIEIAQLGAGQVTVAITTDTLNSSGSKTKLTGQYSTAVLTKITSTSWLMAGDITT